MFSSDLPKIIETRNICFILKYYGMLFYLSTGRITKYLGAWCKSDAKGETRGLANIPVLLWLPTPYLAWVAE
jgi:hypothetical protein